MRIIEFEKGKKRLEFVAGLVWHPLQSTGSARSKELLGYASAQACDLKVIRLSTSPHVGLTKKNDGGKPGQFALAAVIADSLAEAGFRNCLVSLAVPGDPKTSVFVALRDGVILADGDEVGSTEDMRIRLVGDVSYGGWDCIICPPEWGVNDAKQRTLDSFLEGAAAGKLRQWRLTETYIDWKKYAVPAVIVLVLVSAGAYGLSYYKKMKLLEAEALRLQQEELERSQRAALVVEPPKPWRDMPKAIDFVQACNQAFRNADLNGGNWTLDGVVCDGKALTIRWKRTNESAWISHMQAMQPSAVFSDDGTSASVAVSFVAPAPSGADELALPDKGIQLWYRELSSRYGLVISVSSPPAPPPPLPGQMPAPKPKSAWLALPVSIASTLDPVTTVRLVDRPGLRISSIDYVRSEGTLKYQLNGVQYVSI